MTKKERLAQLEIQVADLKQEVAALKRMLALKEDKQRLAQPAPRSPLEVIGPGFWYPSTNPQPPQFQPSVVTCDAKTMVKNAE